MLFCYTKDKLHFHYQKIYSTNRPKKKTYGLFFELSDIE